MPGAVTPTRIEVVRGRLGEERAGQIRGFWASNAALDEEEARRRLGEVVCVLLDDDGAVAGVNSVYRAELESVGGRGFWVYRSLLAEGFEHASAAMVSRAFSALNTEFDPGADGPIGLCVLVDDPEEIRSHPEAQRVWPWLLYAGYAADGRQVRIRYFAGARVVHPGPVLGFAPMMDRRYRIDVFREQEAVDEQAVIDLWAREGMVEGDEARRRVSEVLLVATDASAEPVGVASVYLRRNEQLQMQLWYLRIFVAAAHRVSYLATTMMLVARDHLQRAFMGGQDVRAEGIAMEVENEGLKQRFDEAVWLPADFSFIGENLRGDHVRVHYFPGALAPAPPPSAS